MEEAQQLHWIMKQEFPLSKIPFLPLFPPSVNTFAPSTPQAASSLNRPLGTTPGTTQVDEFLKLTIRAFRGAKTLKALWRIWFDGLPGHHPICELDNIYTVKGWRKSDGDSKFHQRREKVLKKMKEFIDASTSSTEDAINILEQRRNRSNGSQWSINRIAENIDEFFS